MTDTLVTAVGNVITRVLIMEPLAVPDATYATKRWIEYRQDWPYWCNRPGPMSRPSGSLGLPTFDMVIQMRLVLAYITAATRGDVIGTSNVQDKAWEYIPGVVRYFEQYRLLNPPGYAALGYVAPEGVSVAAPQGLTLVTLPAVNDVFICIDFELAVPLVVGASD